MVAAYLSAPRWDNWLIAGVWLGSALGSALLVVVTKATIPPFPGLGTLAAFVYRSLHLGLLLQFWLTAGCLGCLGATALSKVRHPRRPCDLWRPAVGLLPGAFAMWLIRRCVRAAAAWLDTHTYTHMVCGNAPMTASICVAWSLA
jgi:hypothetical protein